MAVPEGNGGPPFRFSLAELLSVLLIITFAQGTLTVILGESGAGDASDQGWITFLSAPTGLLGGYSGARIADDHDVPLGRKRLACVAAGAVAGVLLAWLPVLALLAAVLVGALT